MCGSRSPGPAAVLSRITDLSVSDVADDSLKLRLRDSEKRGVLTRAKARVATARVARQQRLLADMIECLELRQDDFVTVPIDSEDLHRTADDDVSAVASFPFTKDER